MSFEKWYRETTDLPEENYLVHLAKKEGKYIHYGTNKLHEAWLQGKRESAWEVFKKGFQAGMEHQVLNSPRDWLVVAKEKFKQLIRE